MEHKVEIYTTSDHNVELSVTLDSNTVWLNRQQLSVLLGRDVKTIGKHINNVFKEEELSASSTVANFATVQTEGNRQVERKVEYYNLDVIISVGYRVKSQRGTQFRQWATQRLKDYLVQGYAINQKRIVENQDQFLKAIEDLKVLTQDNSLIKANEVLSLIQSFSNTFHNLENFDKNIFPDRGEMFHIESSAADLEADI